MERILLIVLRPRRLLSVYAGSTLLVATVDTLVSRFVLGVALTAYPRRCFGQAHKPFEHDSPLIEVLVNDHCADWIAIHYTVPISVWQQVLPRCI